MGFRQRLDEIVQCLDQEMLRLYVKTSTNIEAVLGLSKKSMRNASYVAAALGMGGLLFNSGSIEEVIAPTLFLGLYVADRTEERRSIETELYRESMYSESTQIEDNLEQEALQGKHKKHVYGNTIMAAAGVFFMVKAGIIGAYGLVKNDIPAISEAIDDTTLGITLIALQHATYLDRADRYMPTITN